MNPGASANPSPSISDGRGRACTEPTSAIRPASIPTSPTKGARRSRHECGRGRMSRSYITVVTGRCAHALTQTGRLPRVESGSRVDP